MENERLIRSSETEKARRRREIREKWRTIKDDFVSMTSLHGLQRAGDHTGRVSQVRRCIWAFFVALGFGAILIITLDQIREYQKHPTSTKTSITYTNSALEFPAVTLCSLNRFYNNSRRKIPERDLLLIDSYEIAETSFTENIPFELMEQVIMGGVQRQINKTHYETMQLHYKQCQKIPGGFKDNYTKQRLQALQYLRCNNLSRTSEMRRIFNTYGYNISHLQKCQMGNGLRKCSANDFHPVYSTKHGLCWTFNGNLSEKAWVQKRAGLSGGLSLRIQNPQAQFIRRNMIGEVFGSGFKVIVHDRTQPPGVDDHGFFIGPGFHSFAEIDLVKESYEKPPWGKCKSNPTGKHSMYSRIRADNDCKRVLSLKNCSCVAPSHYETNDEICDPKALALCVFQEKWNVTVQFNQTSHQDTNLRTKAWVKCNFPQACKKSNYRVSLSSVVWPSLRDVEYYHKLHNISRDILSQDYLALDIYYSEMKYTTISEVTLVYFTNLLSTFGGTTGLFLGASVLTLLELLELILLYFTTHLGGRVQRVVSSRQSSKTSSNMNE